MGWCRSRNSDWRHHRVGRSIGNQKSIDNGELRQHYIIETVSELLNRLIHRQHPSLMVLLVMAVSGIGYGIARLVRYYRRLQRRSLLERPEGLDRKASGDDGDEERPDGVDLLTNRTRYSKAQARQRFRKGKS